MVFNIRDLADELKAAGLMLITDIVWTAVRREKHLRPKLLVIDAPAVPRGWMLPSKPLQAGKKV